MAELVTARRLRFLLNIIDHLPRTSYLAEAMAQDEDLARDLPEQKGRFSPPIREWSTTNELLAQVIDRLGELTAVTASAGAKRKAKPPRPVRRPETARERIQRNNRLTKHRRIVDMVKPRPGRQTMADGNGTDDKHQLVRRRGR